MQKNCILCVETLLGQFYKRFFLLNQCSLSYYFISLLQSFKYLMRKYVQVLCYVSWGNAETYNTKAYLTHWKSCPRDGKLDSLSSNLSSATQWLCNFRKFFSMLQLVLKQNKTNKQRNKVGGGGTNGQPSEAVSTGKRQKTGKRLCVWVSSYSLQDSTQQSGGSTFQISGEGPSACSWVVELSSCMVRKAQAPLWVIKDWNTAAVWQSRFLPPALSFQLSIGDQGSSSCLSARSGELGCKPVAGSITSTFVVGRHHLFLVRRRSKG